eukprot:CAMPEP_0115835456 /NCGR_PEP_ID=MMETSP0287-20121206/4203_1 /TAXON_ID=412157 /ORGANISM="Chrysochromulina rotalis, Strain UIO044" /LENGTH=170 /DNA_ID=CAMNT_0003288913 /DNA_START=42 /DNA_END=554 /DNA_ORIENTATION=+
MDDSVSDVKRAAPLGAYVEYDAYGSQSANDFGALTTGMAAPAQVADVSVPMSFIYPLFGASGGMLALAAWCALFGGRSTRRRRSGRRPMQASRRMEDGEDDSVHVESGCSESDDDSDPDDLPTVPSTGAVGSKMRAKKAPRQVDKSFMGFKMGTLPQERHSAEEGAQLRS